jgi:hypothetical protein
MSTEQAQAYRGQMVEAFAEALGISAEDLKAAIARSSKLRAWTRPRCGTLRRMPARSYSSRRWKMSC